MENNALVSTNNSSGVNLFAFTSMEQALKFSEALSRSGIVPNNFKGNSAACLIALDMANRMKRNPMEVMQAMYVVNGKPGFSSSFLISLINSCGLFERLRFEVTGKPDADDYGCRAWTIEKSSGEKLVGPLITIKMAKEEGWAKSNAAKWRNMPEVMLRYRAAAFFSRLYCPDLTGGIRSAEELSEADVREENIDTNSAVQAELISEPEAPMSNDVLEAEILNSGDTAAMPEQTQVKAETDKSNAGKNDGNNDNDRDEKMREEIMKLMKTLGIRSDEQAVFLENTAAARI